MREIKKGVLPVQKLGEYRRHAEECRKLAMGALSKDNRAQLLDIAETWVKLAATREEMLARYPELDTSRATSPDLPASVPVEIAPFVNESAKGEKAA